MRKLFVLAAVLVVAVPACGSDDDEGSAATTVAGGPTTTLAAVAPTTYEGDGNATITVALPVPGSPAVAAITSTVAGPFVVDALDSGGDVFANLVDVIGAYEGTVPVDANQSQAKTAELQVQAPGPWKVVLSALRDVPRFQDGTQSGEGDAVLAYIGTAKEGSFTFRGQGTAVLIAYPTLDGGFPDTVASLDGASDTPANIDLPGNALLQVTAEGPWELQVAP